jgi:hypothetical protein
MRVHSIEVVCSIVPKDEALGAQLHVKQFVGRTSTVSAPAWF